MSNFCSAPWVSRFVHSDGKITACCFNTTTDIDKLKQSFENNLKDTSCKYCWDQESKNLHSPRYDFLQADADGKEVTMLSINLGNYCNAECIMCNGSVSSSRNTWAKKYNKTVFIENTIQVAPPTNIEFYPNLKSITLIGGEPAIHPSTIKILDDLIARNQHQNLTISLNTNASLLDPKLVERLTQFKEILVTLSIDGAGDCFEYQRRPLKWNTVKSVAEQWMSISDSIVISYVVSAVSIWGFNEFIDWMNCWDSTITSKRPTVIFHPVDKLALSLSVLTKRQREYWIDHAPDHILTKDMIDILNSTTYSEVLHKKFNELIAIEDQTAGKKLSEIIPYVE